MQSKGSRQSWRTGDSRAGEVHGGAQGREKSPSSDALGLTWGADVSYDSHGRELCVRNRSTFKETMGPGEKTPGRA